MESRGYSFGLLPDQFWDLTFHEFFLMQRGSIEKENAKQRADWERTRWLACVMLQPHKKKSQKLQPQDLVKFDWERKEEKIEAEKRRKAAVYAMKKYKIKTPKEE